MAVLDIKGLSIDLCVIFELFSKLSDILIDHVL